MSNKLIDFTPLESLYQELADRMIQRTEYMQIKPVNIVDLGSGRGIDINKLSHRFKQAKIYGIDIVDKLLKYKNAICADIVQLPIKQNYFSIIWSNMTLAYINNDNLQAVFQNILYSLKNNGMLMMCSLGTNSFIEIGNIKRTNFLDMHNIGDMLLDLGFSDPVIDIDTISIEYQDNTNIKSDIYILTGQNDFQIPNMCNMLTLELVYIQAWKDKKVKPIEFVKL